jgi:hypothetical protein
MVSGRSPDKPESTCLWQKKERFRSVSGKSPRGHEQGGGLRTHAYWLEIDISSCYLDGLERQESKKMKKIGGSRTGLGLETMAEFVHRERKVVHTSKEVPNMLSLTKDI